jgi:hypothetical protein
LGSVSRVNEVRINPLLKFEQVLWNSEVFTVAAEAVGIVGHVLEGDGRDIAAMTPGVASRSFPWLPGVRHQ